MTILFYKEKKFLIDIIFSAFSFVIVGSSGILINFIINNFYGVELLGAFSQSYSIYLVFSIISIFGLQYSMIYHTAKHQDEPNKVIDILYSGYLLSLLISIFIALALYFLSFFVDELLKSQNTGTFLFPMIISLPIFSINKITQGHLNGLRKMKTLSLLKIIRMTSFIVILLIFINNETNLQVSLYSIFYSEVLVLLISIFIIKPKKIQFEKTIINWLKPHLIFGRNSFLFSSVAELNTKIDVLILGVFKSDTIVGVYSFYSVVLKGLLGLSNVVQINFSPIITKLWSQRNYKFLLINLQKISYYTYALFIFICVPFIVIAPKLLEFLSDSELYINNINLFYILIIGIIIYSGVDAYNGFLVRIGEPLKQLKIELFILFFNLILSAFLLFKLGPSGVAISTTLTYFIFTLIIYRSAKQKLSSNI